MWTASILELCRLCRNNCDNYCLRLRDKIDDDGKRQNIMQANAVDYASTTSRLRHDYVTTTPRLSHDYVTATSRLRHGYVTTTPRLRYDYVTTTLRLRLDYATATSRLRHDYATTTPRLRHDYVTATSRLRHGIGVEKNKRPCHCRRRSTSEQSPSVNT